MSFEFRLFAVPFIISAVISLMVALLVLQRQNVKGGLALALLMLEFSLWAGANGVRWSLTDPVAQVFWLKLSHAVFVAAPLTFLVFVAQLTGADRWLTRTSLLVLAIEPAVSMLLIATSDYHPLFYSFFHPVMVHGFPEMAWGQGPWFWLNIAFSYAILFAAAVILVRALLRAGPYQRVQLATVLVGCLLPWAVNVYVLFLPSASRQLEVTPLAAAASGLIFAYALFRQRLLEIVPVARSLLFEKLADGVLVLDAEGRILDANRAAQRILQIGDNAYGKHIWETLPHWRDFTGMAGTVSTEMHFELQGRRDPSRFYDISVISLGDGRGRQNGHLISLRDITERKQAELDLHKMNLRLRAEVRKISALQEELKEQAVRDALTGLYNRRYLDETLEREFSRARRAAYSISIIMMDIDGFKEVNDTYGHKAGDRVLRSLSEIIHTQVRAGDIPCRFGGEEFVIVLPETSMEVAALRAEQIRLRFYSARYFKGEAELVPSLSLGIAAYPAHGRSAERVLHAADRAMYAAKSFGGNQAVRYDARQKRTTIRASKNLPR